MRRLLVLGARGASGPLRDPPATATPAVDEATLKEDTRVLSSDAYEGRKPGTPAEAKTIAFIAEQMEKAGLKPGNGDSWYQDVPLVETRVRSRDEFRFQNMDTSDRIVTISASI